MRIGIDVRWLQEAMANRSLGGIGTYSYYLVKGLLSVDSKNEYILFVSEDRSHKEILQIANRNSHARILNLPKDWRIPFMPKSLSTVPTMVQERLSIVPTLGRLELNVFHSLHQFIPPYQIRDCRSAVTVHDLTHLVFPHYYLRRKIYRWVYFARIKALRKASRITTNSENTKNDVIKLLNIHEDKVKVVYHAIGENFHPVRDSSRTRRIMKKYGITGEYVLHVGGISPTKNIGGLLAAFKKLLAMHRKDLKLVIAGNLSFTPYYERVFRQSLKELDLMERVILPGHVPDENLALLYNGACLLVYPSLYEGFGLPPLEAMACGTPVVVSNAASIPEVVGNAGLYVNPYKVDEIVSAMEKVLTNKSLREEMVGRGLERAKLFSWEKTARKTLAIYESLCN